MQVARFTLDLLRPVPRSPLTSRRARGVREGKRIQVVAANLIPRHRGGPGHRVAPPQGRSAKRKPCPTAWWPIPRPSLLGPSTITRFPADPPGREGRRVSLRGRGWVLRRARLVVSPSACSPATKHALARLVYIVDLASGIGQPRRLPVRGINADLTLNVSVIPKESGWRSTERVVTARELDRCRRPCAIPGSWRPCRWLRPSIRPRRDMALHRRVPLTWLWRDGGLVVRTRRSHGSTKAGGCQPASVGSRLVPGGTMASIASMTSALSFTSAAPIWVSNCSIVRGPMIAEEIAGCRTRRRRERWIE